MNFAYKRRTRFAPLLLALLCGGLSLLLAACGSDSPAPFTPNPTPIAPFLRPATTKAVQPIIADPSSKPIPTIGGLPNATVHASAQGKSTVATGPNISQNLELWIMDNSARPADDLQKMLFDFYAKNPGLKINITVLDWNSGYEQILNAIADGKGPDVVQLGWSWIGAMAATKGLRPFSEAELATMDGAENFAPVAWNTTHSVGSTDTVAIPWFVDTRAIYYRTDVLQKTGLDPATAFRTWDNFADTLRKMKDTGLVKAPLAYPGKGDWNVVQNLAPWIWSAGGDLMTPDLSQATFNNDAGVRGVQFYAGLYNQGLVLKEALDKNTSEVEAYFRDGTVGAIISGPWLLRGAKLNKGADDSGFAGSLAARNLGVAQLPAGPGGSKPFVGGSNLAILKNSKNPETALRLVQFLVSRKAQAEYASVSGFLPATAAAQSDQALANDRFYRVFLQSVKDGKTYPTLPAWVTIETGLVKGLGGLWDDVAAARAGSLDPATVKNRLNAAAQQVDSILQVSRQGQR